MQSGINIAAIYNYWRAAFSSVREGDEQRHCVISCIECVAKVLSVEAGLISLNVPLARLPGRLDFNCAHL